MNFPLIGNEHVKKTVGNMLANVRLPHAILIEGDTGLGKTALATYLCKAAICEGETPPCGECYGCRLFESGNHPDITVISLEKDKKTIPIQRVREIIADSVIIPQRANRKVFIIHRADTLTVQAQNALLKVLEEPPESVIFILTAISRAALLETVVSRCVLLTLSPPDRQAAANYIKEITGKDNREILEALTAAHGSIGAALSQLEGKDKGAADALARQFLVTLQSGSEYDLLKLLFPLEKDRVKASDFYSALEVLIVSEIRSCVSLTLTQRYERLYGIVIEHKELLKTNVNLSLLLTYLAAAATER